MRMIVIKQATDLPTLSARLLRDAPAMGTTVEALKRLNPHVDFGAIGPGTVLLVPEAEGVKAEEAPATTRDFFEELRDQAARGVKDAAARVRSHRDATLEVRKEFFNAEALKELNANPEVAGLLKAADTAHRAEEREAAEAEQALDAMQKGLEAEFAALARLLT